jgi:hypothetical protein
LSWTGSVLRYAATVCVTVHALLSALIARVRDDDLRVIERDVRALLASGLPLADLRSAFETGTTPGFVHARAVIEQVAAAGASERRT